MNMGKTICQTVEIMAAVVIGFLVIPPLMKKFGNKLYKASLKKRKMNFET